MHIFIILFNLTPKLLSIKPAIMNTCNICCSKKKLFASCPYCKYDCCQNCILTFITSNLSIECISCKKPLSLQHIQSMITSKPILSKIISTYKEIEYKKQELKFSDTMTIVSKIKKLTKIQTQKTTIKKLINATKIVLNKMNNCLSFNTDKTIITELMLEIKKYNKYLREHNKLYKNIRIAEKILKREINNGIVVENKIKRKKCPGLNCEGFMDGIIADQTYKCITCNLIICNKCEVKKEINHICNDDDIKTIQFIQNTTKECPKCYTKIHKIVGCNHMWCSECKTGFEWNTGRFLSNSENTNPHFKEYKQSLIGTGIILRERDDFICGGMSYEIPVIINQFSTKQSILFKILKSIKNTNLTLNINKEQPFFILKNTCKLCYILQPLISKIRNNINNNTDINLKKRILFLQNKITKTQFCNSIYNNAIKNNNDITYWNLIELLYEILITEINFVIQTIIDTQKSLSENTDKLTLTSIIQNLLTIIDKTIINVIHICDFYNTNIQALPKTYHRFINIYALLGFDPNDFYYKNRSIQFNDIIHIYTDIDFTNIQQYCYNGQNTSLNNLFRKLTDQNNNNKVFHINRTHHLLV